MKGIIIAGGFGTRLRPLTYTRPKHLLPVANRPFLEYQVAMLHRAGVHEVVFATSYLSDQIERHFGDGSRFGVTLRYAIETEPLGTAGAIRNAANLDGPPSEAVLALNGDILTDFDLNAITAFHHGRGAAATIALRAVERPHAFGVLTVNTDGRVLAWHEPTDEEKRRVLAEPGPRTGTTDYINAGIYVLEPETIASIASDRPVSIERETYKELIKAGAPIYGVGGEGYWTDIGNPEQYRAANIAVAERTVRTEVPYQTVANGVRIALDADVDATTCIGPSCSVGRGSRLAGCILLDNVEVGNNARMEAVVVDSTVKIEDDVAVRPGTVLAAGTTIRRGSRL